MRTWYIQYGTLSSVRCMNSMPRSLASESRNIMPQHLVGVLTFVSAITVLPLGKVISVEFSSSTSDAWSSRTPQRIATRSAAANAAKGFVTLE